MPFLDALQDEQLSVFSHYARDDRFPQGSLILAEGDPGDGCFLLDQGTVRLELQGSETDSDSVIGFLEAGQLLGEFSLLDGRPRSASAYAHTSVRARWFSKASFDEIRQLHPDIGIAISNALAENVTAKVRGLVGQIAGYIVSVEIDESTLRMVAKATSAQETFAPWPEERVDALLQDIARALASRAVELGRATVDETGIGVPEHKTMKIRFASLVVFTGLLGKAASGPLPRPDGPVVEMASPVGVVLGLIPITDPVSTISFKALICLKGRNALILSCHRGALNVGNQATDIIREVLAHHGAPPDLVQSIRERTSRRKTMMFMKHPGISLILATGGASMVKAAYSSGTRAIGVGSGNAPVLVCADADIPDAARRIVDSKSFDNGVICGSESNLVVVESAYGAFVRELEANGAIVLQPDEKDRLTKKAFDHKHARVRRELVGNSAPTIASATGLDRGGGSRVIVVPVHQCELAGPCGHEKLAPMLSIVSVPDEAEGIRVCQRILFEQGRGHTAVIHTRNLATARRFGEIIDASRILVNVGASQGCIGIGTGLTPSFTLECGTFGGNSTTDNVSYTHLINVKRLALGA